jgi:hypothetical protein
MIANRAVDVVVRCDDLSESEKRLFMNLVQAMMFPD